MIVIVDNQAAREENVEAVLSCEKGEAYQGAADYPVVLFGFLISNGFAAYKL